MKKILMALGLALAATPLVAGPFDGLYQPAGMNWSCRADQVGMDGGALSIRNNELRGVENLCRLTRPTPVRDMNAVLYDAVCAAEGTQYSERVMILQHSRGVHIIRDGWVSDWRYCR